MPKKFEVIITGYGYRTYTVEANDRDEAYAKACCLSEKEPWTDNDIEGVDYVEAMEISG